MPHPPTPGWRWSNAVSGSTLDPGSASSSRPLWPYCLYGDSEGVSVCCFNLETFTLRFYIFNTPNAFCHLAITSKQESTAENIVLVQETANRLKCRPQFDTRTL